MASKKILEWLPLLIFIGFCIAMLSYGTLSGQLQVAPSGSVEAFYINTILIAVIAIYALVVILQLRATYKKMLREKRNEP
jgi:TRAP-type C4-dicarboxylate transport system permease small subunit